MLGRIHEKFAVVRIVGIGKELGQRRVRSSELHSRGSLEVGNATLQNAAVAIRSFCKSVHLLSKQREETRVGAQTRG